MPTREVAFKTMDVDLAAFLVLQGHVVTSVELSEDGRKGEFVFMDSPGLVAACDRWRFGARDFREFATNRVQLYRWAMTVVDRARS